MLVFLEKVLIKEKSNMMRISNLLMLHSRKIQLFLNPLLHLYVRETGSPDLAPKWVRLAPNRTNPGLFQIRFQYILALKSDLKKSQIWS